MIPHTELDVDIREFSRLPAGPYWMPGPDDFAEDEGLGMFRDVWVVHATRELAVSVLAEERRLIGCIDRLSKDAETFEILARAVEELEPEILPEGIEATEDGQVVREAAESEFASLEGLNLGVSGLAHTLSAIGCITAASCRGHQTPTAWSKRPIVFMAMTQETAKWLQPRIERSGCGIGRSDDLLYIFAPSIEHTVSLAGMILDEFDAAPVTDPIGELFRLKERGYEDEDEDVPVIDIHPDQESLW